MATRTPQTSRTRPRLFFFFVSLMFISFIISSAASLYLKSEQPTTEIPSDGFLRHFIRQMYTRRWCYGPVPSQLKEGKHKTIAEKIRLTDPWHAIPTHKRPHRTSLICIGWLIQPESIRLLRPPGGSSHPILHIIIISVWSIFFIGRWFNSGRITG